jgi:hypothetical protein
MKNTILKICLSTLMVGIVFTSCFDDEIRPAPTISFLTGGDYISDNIAAYAGQEILIGLTCNWNSTDGIKKIELWCGDTLRIEYSISDLDQQSVTIDSISIIKSQAITEEWFFDVIDSQGLRNSLSLTFTLNMIGGEIAAPTSTVIGTPENTVDFSFYSVNYNERYDSTSAENNQDRIDILGAYDDKNGNHFISPDAPNLPEPYKTCMANWLVKNTTKFCATNLHVEQFDAINLDVLILTSYNATLAINKAKNLKDKDIYAFKLDDERIGLFKVTNVEPGATGSVSIDIKVQAP